MAAIMARNYGRDYSWKQARCCPMDYCLHVYSPVCGLAITDPVDRRSSKKKVDKFFSVDVFLKLHDHHRDPACQFFDLFSILPSIFFHSQTFSAALDPALSNLGPLGFYVYLSI